MTLITVFLSCAQFVISVICAFVYVLDCVFLIFTRFQVPFVRVSVIFIPINYRCAYFVLFVYLVSGNCRRQFTFKWKKKNAHNHSQWSGQLATFIAITEIPVMMMNYLSSPFDWTPLLISIVHKIKRIISYLASSWQFERNSIFNVPQYKLKCRS